MRNRVVLGVAALAAGLVLSAPPSASATTEVPPSNWDYGGVLVPPPPTH